MSQRFTVRVGDAVAEAAPDLWGLFIEDLNDALDGGLNAERVRNGDFEFDASEREGFHPLTGWAVEGGVAVRTDDPLHPNNAHYARLTGPAAIANGGWDGVGAARGERMRLSLFARADADTVIDVQVAGGAAAAVLEVSQGGWRHVETDLEAAADGRGELRLAVPADATVDLDAVSLRPLGEDGEPLIFRPDLLQALKDLRPSFIRFPGGCLAHGYGLANVYHWKDTIGPRHERVQAYNIWHYHQSRQIGYLEYFALCEATGATAIPIVAAGVCCQNSPGGQHAIPDDEMDAYVQDVLDLVEFANGGPDTRWGAKRAELGHPEPFGLRYLGIGNEDEITDQFRDRYARIEDALREAHPEVTPIGTVGPAPHGEDYERGWAYARERAVPVVDEHGYQNPRWYHQNLDRWNAYDPEGPKVYLGEYAAWSSKVRSALAEAAYMTAMERRPEVVRLASYAPLLARVGHSQWTPDLIYFTADEVRPSASYYVQQAFGTERGRRVHSVALEGVEHVPVALPTIGTAVLASARASVAFTGVRLDGAPVPDARTGIGGDGVHLGPIDPTACELEFTALKTEGEDGFEIRLGPEAPASSLTVSFGMWQNKFTVVNRSDDGIGNGDHGPVPWRGLHAGEPVHVRVKLDGPRVRVWTDGELRHDYEQDLRPEQRVTAGVLSRDAAGGTEYVVRLVNAEDTAKTAHIAVPGPATAAVTLLAGAGPDDGELFHASPVTPVSLTAKGDDGVDIELPPWSFASAVVTV
ncbi:alpha-L-arabinofuranosidase C-terminal domain-containing protein [Glycomyces mayteni]|uniref:non-reducing end alpha-L-arabinofuranosidase n=1 Tax=Glycomyces mayteni TaxID=543887 RepID=A0ABW2D5X5_9ACTN